MSDIDPGLAVVIPTYKRPTLLKMLLQDLEKQSIRPNLCVIVDGDPGTGDVLDALKEVLSKQSCKTIYVPSNHSNAPYQRYLGAVISRENRWVIFLDDDIRIFDLDMINKIIAPFTWEGHNIVGVSPRLGFPNRSMDRREYHGKYKSGGITPVGDRVPINDDKEYVAVDALRGGCMVYRLNDLIKVIFSENAFAMSHIGCGLGVDDTTLSRQVSQFGKLLCAACTEVIHPDSDSSQVYPTNNYRLGYARAYSRRFINDNYRINRPPTRSDRLFLFKNLMGNSALALWKAFRSINESKFLYAFGFIKGSFHAFTKEPLSRKLTPQINWRHDAEIALNQVEVITPKRH